ncbi:MAG: thioredoxin-disulfide reductase [Nitrososphaerales archaeon]
MVAKSRVVILGAGPAGLTASIYLSRDGLSPIVITGDLLGGQLMLTSIVENFPGFPEGILGPELMDLFKNQAERFGARLVYDRVVKVDFIVRPFKIYTSNDVFEAEAVIVATGASARLLGLEAERRLMGRGVSVCATCDGAFFKGKDVAVVGGGDAAMEDALFLTQFANKVMIIHRRDRLRASPIMQQRVFSNPKISFKWNSVVKDILGEKSVEGVLINDVNSGAEEILNVQGLFVAIGHLPNTEIFKGQLELDERGYIVLKEGSKTSVEGVFAAGDVHDHKYRQAITAAGFGCMAALDVEKYLGLR